MNQTKEGALVTSNKVDIRAKKITKDREAERNIT